MTSIRKPLIICCLLLTCHFANAQYNFSKVDDWLKTNTPDMGGRAVLMIWKDGKTIYSNSENNLNVRQKMVAKIAARRSNTATDEATEDFTPSSKIMIASASKWLSAALVMTFVDEGKLRLDDTVGKYLPVLTQHDKGNITIQQCLSHLTGIKAPPLHEGIQEITDSKNMDEAINKIADLPMEGKPGVTFHYSNVGLQIAGAIIEKISGKNFGTLFKERIATPLNMKNSDFGNNAVALPAGGCRCSAEDYLQFLQMIVNDGVYNGKRILSSQSIAAMQTNNVPANAIIAYTPNEAGNWGYCLGEWVMDDAKPNQRSNAVTSPGLFGTFPWVDNTHHYCGILLTYYFKSEGRKKRYTELKGLVDDAIKK